MLALPLQARRIHQPARTGNLTAKPLLVVTRVDTTYVWCNSPTRLAVLPGGWNPKRRPPKCRQNSATAFTAAGLSRQNA